MSKKYAHFYTDSKIKLINHELTLVKDENNYLFAKGIYKTKILEEDLPDYFVKLYYNIKYHYVSLKGIKDMIYKPNYFTKHLYKDDFLYISYDKPIVKNQNDNFYSNYEILMYGPSIVTFLEAVKKYDAYDVKDIEIELSKKQKWYKKIEEQNKF